jgi:hypothetical protein
MTLQLPRLLVPEPLDDVAELAERFYRFTSDVYDFLRLLPTVEFKMFTTVGNFPIYVETQTTRAISVKRVQTYETLNAGSTAAYLADTSISWRLSDDPDQPGIIVTGLGGVVGPAELTITLEIMGERVSDPTDQEGA